MNAKVITYEDIRAAEAAFEELENARDARIADEIYEAYLRDPSGARPLDELVAEWDEMDAKRDKASR